MHAIIRQGKGKFYTSRLFGWFTLDKEDSAFSTYGIVLNPEKTKLVKVQEYDVNERPYLKLMVLVCDSDGSSWVSGENYGVEKFIPQDEILEMIDEDRVSQDILAKCIELDSAYEYKEWHQVTTDKEIEDLMWVSGYFHDAIIKDMKVEGEVLTLLMEGCWGCSVELKFSKDIAYETESRNPDDYDPYWLESSVVIEDGFVWFIDAMDIRPKELNNSYCWFRARMLEYKVIPD